MKTAPSQTASLDAKIAAKRAGRLATAPSSWRGVLKRSWSPKCSPRAAVKAFCGECNGFDRDAIKNCTCWACPLWAFRPFQKDEAHNG
jgi:hypothetical protein